MSFQENQKRLGNLHTGSQSLLEATREKRQFLRPGDARVGGNSSYAHFADGEVKIKPSALAEPIIMRDDLISLGEAGQLQFAGDPAGLSFLNDERRLNNRKLSPSILFPAEVTIPTMPFVREFMLLKDLGSIQQLLSIFLVI